MKRVVGETVSAVCFGRSYVEVMFKNLVLSCYTLPSIHSSYGQTSPGGSGYRNRLCELIGKRVQSVAERSMVELAIYLEEGDSIHVSLRPEDAVGPEAAILRKERGDTLRVWP